jgi:hypothetical protein
LDDVIVHQSPFRIDRLITPSLPATATAAFLLHRKPTYLAHNLKTYPIEGSARVADSKIIDPTHNHRADLLKDLLELSMPTVFQYHSHAPDQFALLLSHRGAQDEPLAKPIAPRSDIKPRKTKTPPLTKIHHPRLFFVDLDLYFPVNFKIDVALVVQDSFSNAG